MAIAKKNLKALNPGIPCHMVAMLGPIQFECYELIHSNINLLLKPAIFLNPQKNWDLVEKV
jgi:hypothetical protein